MLSCEVLRSLVTVWSGAPRKQYETVNYPPKAGTEYKNPKKYPFSPDFFFKLLEDRDSALIGSEST